MGEKLIPITNSSDNKAQSLPQSVQHKMETQFGQDFSDVRVHTDSQSNVAARAVGAKAFTSGNDIFFSKENYDPHSSSGIKMLAHEMAHIVQQRLGGNTDVPKGMAKVETDE